MSVPKVTGFVPVYNAEAFLEKTLLAIAAIDYPHFNIVIGDDCSSDQTLKIARKFAANDSRFQVMANTKNLGWFHNIEQLWLLSAKSSDFCFLISHDDIPTSDFISAQLDALLHNPDAVLCCPQMQINHYSGAVKFSELNDFGMSNSRQKRIREIISETSSFWYSAFHGLHKSSAVLKIVPFQNRLFHKLEFKKDLIWLLRMALVGRFVTIPAYVYHKNVLKSSLSGTWKSSLSINILFQFNILQEVLFSNLKLLEKLNLSLVVMLNLVKVIHTKVFQSLRRL